MRLRSLGWQRLLRIRVSRIDVLQQGARRAGGSRFRVVLTGLGLLMAMGLAMPRELSAQVRGQAQRVVEGKVTNKADAPLQGAVVYLKDDKTLAVKSFIATEQGTYRFGQLSQNTDYEVWAESGGKKSATKIVSSLDSKNDFTVNLKIDTTK